MSDYSEMNIYEKIMLARKMFHEEDIKKSGENKFQNFTYLELQDIVPPAVKICEEVGLYTHTDLGYIPGYAIMIVRNIDNIEETVTYKLKAPKVNEESNINAQLQDTGKSETYLRRYLYMLFLDIAVPDDVDKADNSSKRKVRKSVKTTKEVKTSDKPKTEEKPKKPTPKRVKKAKTSDKPKKSENTSQTLGERNTSSNLSKILTKEQLDELSSKNEYLKVAIDVALDDSSDDAICKKDIMRELTNMVGNNRITPDDKSKLNKTVVSFVV